MFPHLNQRSVRWELERNGASVERAVERALREGGLPEVR
jgi:coupling of ubiquitin conjugation to ER degradation protein 1